MREACIIASILSNQPVIFDEFKDEPPTQGIFWAASKADNEWYLEQLLPRMEALGLEFNIDDAPENEDYTWIWQPTERLTFEYNYAHSHLRDFVEYTEAYDYDQRQEAQVDIVYSRIFSAREELEERLEKQRLNLEKPRSRSRGSCIISYVP